MGIWKANVASDANAHNFVIKVAGKTETAELVQKLENRFGRISKNIFSTPIRHEALWLLLSFRRERPGAAVLRDGESDAEAFLAQGELEMKKGSDGRRCLFYLDKAVELNDYDEEVIYFQLKTGTIPIWSFKGLHRQEQVRKNIDF